MLKFMEDKQERKIKIIDLETFSIMTGLYQEICPKDTHTNVCVWETEKERAWVGWVRMG